MKILIVGESGAPTPLAGALEAAEWTSSGPPESAFGGARRTTRSASSPPR